MNEQKAVIKPKITREKVLAMSHDFYNTKKAFIVLIGISLFFTIIQFILYATGVLKMGIDQIDVYSPDAWIGWASLTLSGVGVIFQFIGSTYSMRFDRKKSVIFLPFGQFLVVLNAVLMGLYLMAFTFTCSIFIAISRYFIWDDSDDNSDKTTPLYWIILAISAIAFISILIPLYAFKIIPFDGDGTESEWLKYVDVINSVLLLSGMVTFTMKSRWCFIIFGISGITSLMIMIPTDQIVLVVSTIIFKFNDAISYMAWTAKEKVPGFVAVGDL